MGLDVCFLAIHIQIWSYTASQCLLPSSLGAFCGATFSFSQQQGSVDYSNSLHTHTTNSAMGLIIITAIKGKVINCHSHKSIKASHVK